jgi:outer membrane protein OmpA-like peptidoglycan-associated protein
MTETPPVRRIAAAGRRLPPLPLVVGACLVGARIACVGVLIGGGGASRAEAPAVVDRQSIVRGLKSDAATTRSLVVGPRTTPAAGHSVTLDIRFANDSDHLSSAAHAQLAELGAALSSPELVHSRFLIAGHTSASGGAGHNQRLSEARARSVRRYLLEHFHVEPQRIESTGYGASRPRPEFPPNALQQRRVEISLLPPAS